jgi:hypothetical protein
MANFVKQTSEKSKAKSGEGPAIAAQRNDEHEAPPRLLLSHSHIKALGFKELPKVGSKIKISGLAHVGATSEGDDSHGIGGGATEGSSKNGGPKRSMTLHIHKMDIGTDQQSTDAAKEEQSAKGAKAAMDKALTRGEGSESAGEAVYKNRQPQAGKSPVGNESGG